MSFVEMSGKPLQPTTRESDTTPVVAIDIRHLYDINGIMSDMQAELAKRKDSTVELVGLGGRSDYEKPGKKRKCCCTSLSECMERVSICMVEAYECVFRCGW